MAKKKTNNKLKKSKKTVKENKKDKDSKKEETIDAVVKKIKERFGEGSIMRLGEAKKVDVDAISTGSISLNYALGIGGVPKEELLKFMDRNPPVKPLWPCILSPTVKKAVEQPLLSMQSMLWIPPTLKESE